MIPVYFPYTYIPEKTASTFFETLGPIKILQPTKSAITPETRAMAEKGMIEVQEALKLDEERLKSVYKAYTKWADLHKEEQIKSLKARLNSIPFFGESSSYRLRSEIRKGANDSNGETVSDVFMAALFLKFAEDLDIRHAEIERQMHSFENMENKLIRELKGEKSFQNGEKIHAAMDQSSYYMIPERLDAWTCLMQSEIMEPCLFISDKRDVMDHIFDAAHHVEKINTFFELPVFKNPTEDSKKWRNNFYEYASRLANGEKIEKSALSDPPGEPPHPTLELYRVKDETPKNFFSRFSRRFFCTEFEIKDASESPCTLMGLFTL